MAQTKALLEHSYKVMDSWLIGVSLVQGMGDFNISSDDIERELIADYDKFKTLYADELKRGLSVKDEVTKSMNGGGGSHPLNSFKDRSLIEAVLRIDEVYKGAIDNLSWSNTESSREPDVPGIDEEKEYWFISQWNEDSRFMKARDVLQRYTTWFFGGKNNVEGLEKEIRPVPENVSNSLK